MESSAEIKDFIQDRGKNEGDDGRLIIQVDVVPEEKVISFLEWLGNQFIEKGGLYAVDIKNPLGIFRVYKSDEEKNQWIEFKNKELGLGGKLHEF